MGQAGEIVIENHELGSVTISSQSVSNTGGSQVITPLYPVKGKLVLIKCEDVDCANEKSNPMNSKLKISPAFILNS